MAKITLDIPRYARVDYRSVRAKHPRQEFPQWFNRLITEGFVSIGCCRAAKNDKSILPRIENIFKASAINPNTIVQYNPLTIQKQAESRTAQLLRGKPNQTELSIIYLEKSHQYVFTTKNEISSINQASSPIIAPLVSLEGVRVRERETTFTLPQPMGGKITFGVIEKTLSSGQITIWGRQGKWQLFRPSRSDEVKEGDKIQLFISGEDIAFFKQDGTYLGCTRILDEKGQQDNGLQINRFSAFLPWVHGIVGHFYKMFSKSGVFTIGEQRFVHPELPLATGLLEFSFGNATLSHVPLQGIISPLHQFAIKSRPSQKKERVSQEDAANFTGSVVRTVGEHGAFGIGNRTIYIDSKYVGTNIQIVIANGTIIKIYHAMGYQIPLDDLRITRFFGKNQQTPQFISHGNWRSPTTYLRREGFLELPSKSFGGFFFFGGDRNIIEGGYNACFAHIINGVIVGLRYYDSQNALPNMPPDKETAYKRLYIDGKLAAARQSEFKKSHFTLIERKDAFKITHLKISPSGNLEVGALGIHMSLKDYSGKYVIVHGSLDNITISIYDDPETDPEKPASKSITKPCVQEGEIILEKKDG